MRDHGSLDHAHREPAVAPQDQIVHDVGHEVETATVHRHRARRSLAVERLHIEAVARVADLGDEVALLGEEADLDILLGAAVADGVGAGLLDREDHVVDRDLIRAVLLQVVAHALAGPEQPRWIGREAEGQARQRDAALQLFSCHKRPSVAARRSRRILAPPERERSTVALSSVLASFSSREKAKSVLGQTIASSRSA